MDVTDQAPQSPSAPSAPSAPTAPEASELSPVPVTNVTTAKTTSPQQNQEPSADGAADTDLDLGLETFDLEAPDGAGDGAQVKGDAKAATTATPDQSLTAEKREPFEPKAFLKTLPNRPGSYRMYDVNDVVIYVGKAKDLKKRLSSYFLKHGQSTKTKALVSNIARIEFTVTFSESEALILENELIKQYQPRYNILLRDDKSYPYILLTSKHEHPGIYYHRGAKRRLGEYFGPFPDSNAVKESLRLLQRLFPVRQCEDSVYSHRSRPCLMAQMGRCLAPCVEMSPEKAQHYQEQVALLRLFLKGQNQKLLQTMVQKMEEHAAKLEFEEAALLRDQMTALRRIQESNSIISDVDYPLDVVGHHMQDGMFCVHVLFIRQGRILGSRSFFPKLGGNKDSAHILFSFLTQFYLNESHSAMLPDEILLDCNLIELSKQEAARSTAPAPQASQPDAAPATQGSLGSQSSQSPQSSQNTKVKAEVLAEYGAAAAKVQTREALQEAFEQQQEQAVMAAKAAQAAQDNTSSETPAAASDTSEVQAVAEALAELTEPESADALDLSVLAEALKSKFSKQIRFAWVARGAKSRYVKLATTNAQVALQSKLSSEVTAHQRIEDLEKVLGISGVERMECYDISHTMGENTVASCVVFNREGPDSSRYRRYNIHGIRPGDDFAAMHQVLSRRFRDPDNGELPQLIFIDGGKGQLAQAEEVLTKAFAKATRPMPLIVAVAKGEGRKEGLETLILGFTHETIKLSLSSPALQLVIHIRDESHRFAITGHRAKRSKARTTSKLESIAGVGPKRRQALLQHMGGMQEILRASIDELKKVPGISAELAAKIYDELHSL